uniref:Uncharacterized protein n=1 Tax=Panagrellus redivivus TaxID=6233 RepID=A0A7E4UL77_PANRE
MDPVSNHVDNIDNAAIDVAISLINAPQYFNFGEIEAELAKRSEKTCFRTAINVPASIPGIRKTRSERRSKSAPPATGAKNRACNCEEVRRQQEQAQVVRKRSASASAVPTSKTSSHHLD